MSVIYQGDEARAWLSASLFVNRLLVFAYKSAHQLARLVFVYWGYLLGLWLLASFTLVATQDYFHIDGEQYYATYSLAGMNAILDLAAVMVYLLPIICLVSLLSKSNPIVFGWESLYYMLLVNLRVDAVPYHLQDHLQVYRSRYSYWQKPTIRHSLIYADPQVITDIANWIKTK